MQISCLGGKKPLDGSYRHNRNNHFKIAGKYIGGLGN